MAKRPNVKVDRDMGTLRDTVLRMARQQFTATSSGTLKYLEVCDPDTLRPVSTYTPESVLVVQDGPAG